MESLWKLRGGRGGGGGSPEAEISKRYGVRREIFFQGVQEHCPKETYQDRICDLVDQQIHELQYISESVFSNAIRTFLEQHNERFFSHKEIDNSQIMFIFFNYYSTTSVLQKR